MHSCRPLFSSQSLKGMFVEIRMQMKARQDDRRLGSIREKLPSLYL